MTLLTEYPRALSATHPQDNPKSCTFILVSNEWMHQRSTNTKLGLKIAPEEKVVYLLSFSRHEHAFRVTNPSRANLGIISLVSAFCKEGISHNTTAVGPDDKLSFTLPLSQVHDRCGEDNCGLVLPELRKEDASLSVTLTIMTLGKAIQLYNWKQEEFEYVTDLLEFGNTADLSHSVAFGNGKAFGEGLAAQMLTKELALVRGANQVVNVWLSNQIGSNDVGHVPNIVGYLQVPANHPMFAQFLGNLNKSFFDQYGVIFNFRDLPQGYTLWWKARRSNPTNQQGQVQGAFYVWTPSIPNNTRSALLSGLRGARYCSSPIRQGFKKNIETTIKLH
ncbi:hypothetical protein D6C87_02459 [Aureobasidium pullulans]|uniref:Beta-glucuronidase C-terminal domain-containing protein n=1 Tax=Aureobasidium pullulans TaxID=5580 RepID=A0AB38LUW9_AURPU|nr:hypothetical protein D6C94_06568 [Aureobasidium pullulans]THZ46004.1 hypothetical protein D6C87_02459 [Aureobasidium pullulans]